MSPYEIIMVIIQIALLIIAAVTLGRDNSKK